MVQYLKIEYGKPFKIPRRLGDLFKDIVKIKGVSYVRQAGFVVEDKAALDALNRILVRLGLILLPVVKCYICGGYVDCESCEFKKICKQDVRYCICSKCMSKKTLVADYLNKQRRLILGSIGMK